MKQSIISFVEKNMQFLNAADRLVSYFRHQKYFEAFDLSKEVVQQLNDLVIKLILEKDDFNSLNLYDDTSLESMLLNILGAQESKDYILLADLFEIQVIPFFVKMQEFLISSKELIYDEKRYQRNMESIKLHHADLVELINNKKMPFEMNNLDYKVEHTSSGMTTLSVLTPSGWLYMHSNFMPQREADNIASEWFEMNAMNYAIWGLGLGYHVTSLSNLSEYINIKVYESDLEVIKLACVFSDVGDVLKKDNIQLVYEHDEKKLLQKMLSDEKDTVFGIHYPSMMKTKSSEVRENLENFFIHNNSLKRYQHTLAANFKSNIHCYDEIVDVLEPDFKGKSLYIVAAGPSLDKNYMELKNIGSDGIILATGTVFRKLLNAGIRPNYIIGIDSTKLIYNQIVGLENENIPMIALSTVYNAFLNNYKGKKYIVFQKGYKRAEEVVGKKNCRLYHTGGSVSTLALDLGIQFNCKRIIFLGLDLAYPNGYMHASETTFDEQMNTKNMLQVQDIYGNSVSTSKNMNIYRKWIEKRIQGVGNIEIIDATEGGAKIEGMKIQRMSECIDLK